MFSLSTFQSEGRRQDLFHLRNIQKDVTVNSDLDRRIQKYLEKVELEYQAKPKLIELLTHLVN